MIQVNLLPGGRKRPSKRTQFSFRLAKGGSRAPGNKWVLGAAATVVLSLVGMGYLWSTLSARTAGLDSALEAAVRDSARYADLIAKTEMLQARRDSIAQKVDIIQQIDAQRYVWSHLMDEVARSVPDYTWLTSVVQVQTTPTLLFRIEGKAGNNFALTRFWNNLESSSFIRNVRLISTEQTMESPDQDRTQLVYSFTLEAEFEEPPLEALDLVPLLGAAAGQP